MQAVRRSSRDTSRHRVLRAGRVSRAIARKFWLVADSEQSAYRPGHATRPGAGWLLGRPPYPVSTPRRAGQSRLLAEAQSPNRYPERIPIAATFAFRFGVPILK